MPRTPFVPVWKPAPFIRLLLPLCAGIFLQWKLSLDIDLIAVAAGCFLLAIIFFQFLPLSFKFKAQVLQGALLNLLLLLAGLMLCWQKDIRHRSDWYGNILDENDWLLVRIDEPPVEKPKSLKAETRVEAVFRHYSAIACTGKIMLYFAKDSASSRLQYGDQLLISKKLQPIQNSGNPGAFDYRQYASFQQLYHTVYLTSKDWAPAGINQQAPFRRFIYSARSSLLAILQKHIGADKDALGIAEALLIGYSNDLDKDLVQAYSNTGVVHIIAISGMHLALIYVLLVWIFKRLPIIKRSQLVQVILVLCCLWLFSLLTGASASVLRAAVMFSFVALGKAFGKSSSIYNSLAASAFVLLCYNPYYLWDVGFQLSYLAVAGIVLFQRPLYNLFYIKPKWPDKIWELAAVSLAAQVLTFPVCIYYFHQFPTVFLLANLVAVPLSAIVLYAEMILLILSPIPILGMYMGRLTAWLLALMNNIIRWFNELPFAVWDQLHATVASTILMYGVVFAVSTWLLNKYNKALLTALGFLLSFVVLRSYNQWCFSSQSQLIVYNVPRHQAIDFVSGHEYSFIGDSILLEDAVLRNFHLKPGRISMQLQHSTDSLPGLLQKEIYYQWGNKKIVLIDRPLSFSSSGDKQDADIIILSKNAGIHISELAAVFNCKRYVFDASNSLWKIANWQKECEALHLQCYSIPEQGAFVADL